MGRYLRCQAQPLSLVGWLVCEDGEARTGRFGAGERQHDLVASVPEEAPSCSQGERIEHDAIDVDQAVLHQRVHQLTTAVDENALPRLLLQRPNRFGDVTLESCGVPCEWLAESS